MKYLLLIVIGMGMLNACSKPTPEEIALTFISEPTYSLLSEEDKQFANQEEFADFIKSSDIRTVETSPSDSYWQIEKFLKGQVTYSIKEVKGSNPAEVVYEFQYPTLLDEFYFGFKQQNAEYDEKLAIVQRAFQSEDLMFEDLEFSTFEYTLKVVDHRIYLNLKEHKQIKLLNEELSELTSQSAELSTALMLSDNPEYFQKMRTLLESLPSESELVRIEQLISELEQFKQFQDLEIDPFQTYKRFIGDWQRVQTLLEVFNDFTESLHFFNVHVAETTSGGRGLFFHYAYDGKVEIKALTIKAEFLDDNGTIVGEYIYHPFFTDLRPKDTDLAGKRIFSSTTARRPKLHG